MHRVYAVYIIPQHIGLVNKIIRIFQRKFREISAPSPPPRAFSTADPIVKDRARSKTPQIGTAEKNILDIKTFLWYNILS